MYIHFGYRSINYVLHKRASSQYFILSFDSKMDTCVVCDYQCDTDKRDSPPDENLVEEKVFLYTVKKKTTKTTTWWCNKRSNTLKFSAACYKEGTPGYADHMHP